MTHQKKNMSIKTITKNIKASIQNSLGQFDINLSKKALNLSPPKQESFGDLSSNIALTLAKQIKRNPLEIAEKVCQDLINNNIDYIDDITVTPPGFINFVIDKKFYQDNLKLIIKNGVEFGKDLSVKKRNCKCRVCKCESNWAFDSRAWKKCGYRRYYFKHIGMVRIRCNKGVLL